MTITQNIRAILAMLDIQGVEIIDELGDRVNAIDADGELRKHIAEHPEHWQHDAWDPLHRHIAASYRERTGSAMITWSTTSRIKMCSRSLIAPTHLPLILLGAGKQRSSSMNPRMRLA